MATYKMTELLRAYLRYSIERMTLGGKLLPPADWLDAFHADLTRELVEEEYQGLLAAMRRATQKDAR